MKKIIALTLAGAMVFSTPVMAKEVGAPVAVYLEDSSYIGIPAETVLAIDEDKTISEHMNNAVVDIWDMNGDDVQDLAVGQGAVLDGVEAPGLTFELMKPELKRVYAAKKLAEGKGTLLTVANVHTHAGFSTAKVTFYAPGVKAGQAITVYQRVTDDEWTAVPTVVSDDKVVVDITSNGHLAFIEAAAVAEPAPAVKPAAVAKVETAVKPAAAAKAETTEIKAEAKAEATDKAEVKAEAADKAEVKAEAADKAEDKAEAADKAEDKAETTDKAEDKAETTDKAADKAETTDKAE